jgi:hypothetical protein
MLPCRVAAEALAPVAGLLIGDGGEGQLTAEAGAEPTAASMAAIAGVAPRINVMLAIRVFGRFTDYDGG